MEYQDESVKAHQYPQRTNGIDCVIRICLFLLDSRHIESFALKWMLDLQELFSKQRVWFICGKAVGLRERVFQLPYPCSKLIDLVVKGFGIG